MLYCLHSNGKYSYFKKSRISMMGKEAKRVLKRAEKNKNFKARVSFNN